MNHAFLDKRKCHNPKAGTYPKVIIMFDLHIYSKISLERKENCLFQICELPRDYCYETHIVRGWISSEVSTDRDEHVGHSLAILGSPPAQRRGECRGEIAWRKKSSSMSVWMDAQEAVRRILKMGSLGNSELPHNTKVFLNMMLRDLTKCLTGFHLH